MYPPLQDIVHALKAAVRDIIGASLKSAPCGERMDRERIDRERIDRDDGEGD